MGAANANIRNKQFIPAKQAQILFRKENLNTHTEIILEELPFTAVYSYYCNEGCYPKTAHLGGQIQNRMCLKFLNYYQIKGSEKAHYFKIEMEFSPWLTNTENVKLVKYNSLSRALLSY